MPHVTDDTVLTLWDSQVRNSPDAIAVIGRQATLTYAELAAATQRLAAHLRASGAVQETAVALYFDRDDHHAVVALLAVLQAGAAYVPLDPTHPAERVAHMLADSGAPIVLSTTARAATLPFFSGTIIAVDDPCPDRQWQPVTVSPDTLAYVLYTSGSTGTPKGVMVTHGGLANYLRWARDAYTVANGSGAPVHSPLTFDLTITALLVPLVAGKAVHLLPETAGAEALHDALLRRDDWSVVKLTPAHLDLLRATLPLHTFATRRHTFVIGGEALTAAQTAPWREACPSIRLINEYGPTETVVGCCTYEVTGDEPPDGIPIGTPIANTQLYVLDAALRPTPAGEIGDLYIGGAGVARGYRNRPALTAERFIPDPFGAAGSRLYKSGDRARMRPDGLVEYCGRADTQLKIRGYRIEPGEIEAALRRHPAVRDAVVTAADSATGKHLMAYVVAATGQEVNSAAVRESLYGIVPAYMVPPFIIPLEALPLTANGKVDRTRLPAPPTLVPTTPTPPATPIEALVFEIWAEVLGRADFDATADFFASGGHSLLAVQVLARIRMQLDLDIPLLTFFHHPTLQDFAVVVETLLFAAAESSDPVDVDQPSPLGA